MTRIIRVKTNVKTHRGSIYLVPLGDIHRAARNCDVPLLNKVYKWIKTHDCLVLGMGDYSEWIGPKDRRYDLDAYFKDLVQPDSQYKQILKEFTPFKEKIIALLDGNHDFSYYQHHYHNYVDTLAHELGTEYGTFDAIIRLEIHREKNSKILRVVDIYAHHGWTGSRTTGGKVNRIEDLGKIFPKLPLYLMGHVHTLGVTPPKKSLGINQADQIIEITEHYVFTGSFLRGFVDHPDKPFSGYVARKGYTPTSLGAPLIKIQPFRNAGHGGQDKLHIEVRNVPI